MARDAKKSADELAFVALGGLGEIGMNVYLYGYGPPKARKWIMVDLGITFAGPTEPGVDIVLPDLQFIEENPGPLNAIIITHAHEDHVGAVIEMWPRLRAPIYATPFTVGMLQAKLSEFGNDADLPINEIPLGGRIDVDPFSIELVSMAHSIPEPSGLIMRTPAGTVFHTGDWKLDEAPVVGEPTDEKRLAQLGDDGVLALVCDSTNVLRDGASPSESEVARSLRDIVKRAEKRVVVTTFASNVGRVKAIADAAKAAGRHLVVAGRALRRVIDVAIDTGYLPADLRYSGEDAFSYLDRNEVLLLCTGSQGEPRAALSRIAEGEHHDISLAKDDLVIFSSRDIPGNEKAIGRVQNALAEQGCRIMTDNDALVHVTGHPRRDELKKLYGWIKPQIVVPMHGEARHLSEHARFAKALGVKTVVPAYNGDLVCLSGSTPGIADRVPTGRLHRDGRLIVDSIDGPVRERRKLSAVGIAVVSVALSRQGELLSEPDVVLDGVPFETADGDDMEDVVLDAVEGTIKSIPKARRKDPDLVAEAIRRSVRSAIADEWGKKPITKALVHVVNGQPSR